QDQPVQEGELAGMNPVEHTQARWNRRTGQEAQQPPGSAFQGENKVPSGPAYGSDFTRHGRGQHTVEEAGPVAKQRKRNGEERQAQPQEPGARSTKSAEQAGCSERAAAR